jgi:hypothetical protein
VKQTEITAQLYGVSEGTEEIRIESHTITEKAQLIHRIRFSAGPLYFYEVSLISLTVALYSQGLATSLKRAPPWHLFTSCFGVSASEGEIHKTRFPLLMSL